MFTSLCSKRVKRKESDNYIFFKYFIFIIQYLFSDRKNGVPIFLNVTLGTLHIFTLGRTGSVGARRTSKITAKPSHLASRRGVRSMRRPAISFVDRINIGASPDTTRVEGREGETGREGLVL